MTKRERILEHDHSDRFNGGALAGQALNPGSTSSTTTVVTSGGAAVLDELGDVNTSTTPPSNGDVLTYDSTSGLWLPDAATASVAELDDVGDVNAPTPSNGDVLTWDSTPGEWVALAPTGVADILDIPTAETDTTLVLAPDGAGGVEFRAETGGGGTTIQYPGLKPSPPTYDFDGAALDGAFSAHSSLGSFTTSHVITQGEAWGGSSVELQFSGQMGQIYVGHSNTDFDFEVGGVRKFMHPLAAMMIGIAALDSAGNGVGVVAYNDGHAYLAGISAYQYTGNSDSWSSQGQANASLDGDWWFRLKRISGTWTGYLSRSGRAWDKVFATRADSITVDRLAFGQFYNTVTPYYGRLAADYMHVTT